MQHAWSQVHSLANPSPTDPNSNDMFVAILTADLTGRVYASYVNSGQGTATLREEPSGLAVDPLGNIYLTGETDSSDFPVTGNAFDPTFSTSGQRDCFIVKLYPGISSPSMLLYSSFFGGDIDESAPSPPQGLIPGSRGRSLQFIGRGSTYANTIVLCGSTTTSDLPTTPGVAFEDWLFMPPPKDKQQGFVAVHDPN